MHRSSQDEPGLQHRRTVLLAEDDENLRGLLAETFRAENFAVIEASNGLDLVETLVSRLEAGEQPFDLVVSDVRMPGVTGLSVCEGLLEWEAFGDLPVVLITAFPEPRLHALARECGSISLLEKPFEMTALMRIVREAIDG